MRISGFGQDGPYSERPGFGTLVEAMSGVAAKTGFADREPVLPPLALADMVAGLYGAYAVMGGAAGRRTDGSWEVIDVPLLDPVFSILGPGLRAPAPTIGQHTRQVLAAIGCDAARIAILAAQGVIKKA